MPEMSEDQAEFWAQSQEAAARAVEEAKSKARAAAAAESGAAETPAAALTSRLLRGSRWPSKATLAPQRAAQGHLGGRQRTWCSALNKGALADHAVRMCAPP